MMPTTCTCSHGSIRHGARSRMCLDCACRRFALPVALPIETWRGSDNYSMGSPALTAFRNRTLEAAERAGHVPSLVSGSYDGASEDIDRRRWLALCGRCHLGILMHLWGGVLSLDPLSSAALGPCIGQPIYPLEPWAALGIRNLPLPAILRH